MLSASNDSVLLVGETIVATCDAKPSVQFIWIGLNFVFTQFEASITITADMRGGVKQMKVIATNKINGVTYSAETAISFSAGL
jgi:hypothetical protein